MGDVGERRLLRVAAAVACAWIITPTESVAAQVPVRITEATVVPTDSAYLSAVERGRQVLDSLAADLAFPGVGIAVAVDGQIVWAEGLGFADAEREIPVDRRSVFPIYSISKGLTGLALARLAEQGRIDLDAPIQLYLPQFPAKEGGAITARLLAGHLGGIRHYAPGAGEGTRLRHCDTALEALAPFANDPLVHPPGTDFHYTSYGFVLLSAVMASAARQPFADLVEAEVLRPLAMTSAAMGDTKAWVSDLVSTYELREGVGAVPARRMDVTCKMGAGGFVATAEDLARMASAMFSGDYLTDATRDLLFTGQRNAAGERIVEGLGWDVGQTDDGLRWVRRVGGNVDGWGALMAYPDSRIAIAILANMRGEDWIHDDAHRIAQEFIAARARSEVATGGDGR